MQVWDKVKIASDDPELLDIRDNVATITRVFEADSSDPRESYAVEVEDGVWYEVWSDEIVPA